jgi:hypothetical protein
MSHYANLATNIVDQEALIRALCHMRNRNERVFTRNQIEVHEKAQHLYGYQNDERSQTANVIIRRANVGGNANDVGFVKGKDGRFSAIISEYDSGHYTAQWLSQLTTWYGVEKSKIELDAKGIKYVESTDAANGNCPTLEAFFEAPKAKTVANFFG